MSESFTGYFIKDLFFNNSIGKGGLEIYEKRVMNKKHTAPFPFYKVHEVSVYYSIAQDNHYTSCTNHSKKDKEPTHCSGLCPQ